MRYRVVNICKTTLSPTKTSSSNGTPLNRGNIVLNFAVATSGDPIANKHSLAKRILFAHCRTRAYVGEIPDAGVFTDGWSGINYRSVVNHYFTIFLAPKDCLSLELTLGIICLNSPREFQIFAVSSYASEGKFAGLSSY